MKKFILFILFILLFGLFSNLINCQDTIIKADGQKIICKIIKEDSTSIYLSVKKNDIYLETYINKKEVLSVKRKQDKPEVYQKFNDRDFVLKLDLLLPSIGLETRIGLNKTFLVAFQPGFLITSVNDGPNQTYIVNQIRASYRYFNNIENRESKGKSTDKFSGNFVSMSALAGFETPASSGYVTIGPTIGLQRNWEGYIHFSIEIGAGFVIGQSINIEPTGDLKFGIAL